MIKDAKIKDILLRGNYVSAADMKKAEEFIKAHHITLFEYLLSKGLINDKDLLGQAIAESFGVPYADLNSNQPSREQILKIPRAIAKKYKVAIFFEDNEKLIVTTDNPQQSKLTEILRKLFPGKKINIAYSLSEDFEGAFIHYHKSLDARFIEIIKSSGKIAPEIITEIIEDALAYRASDVHFEPDDKGEVVVRFRIDGVLHEAGIFSKKYYDNILNLIKVQAHLRFDEHFTAQDGAIRYSKEGKAIDLRVSVVPTVNGEKTAIRILSHYLGGYSLAEIGLSQTDQAIITASSKKPFGMILVAGPTGSGKTTTLYSVLKILNTSDVNITTIEEPVEYKISGINQIQVNHQTNLTFAKGLRSIIRQDPDIILVGEIRDKETIEIAVNAALTGHLLLSSFHANDAASAIPRLLEMEAEPFLLASTLELIVAQRLVRRICEKCRYSVPVKQDDLNKISPNLKKYFKQDKLTLYKGKGCEACNSSGYRGRVAVFEIIRNTPELQDLILKIPSAKQIWQLAHSQGSKSLFEDGIEKVKNGITTIEELMRVAAPNI